MTTAEIKKAKCDIEATADLLERAMKLSGLVTTLFQERGFALVVVGGSAVEFYTEGGYAEQDAECVASARQMMASALADASFDWTEAKRLAALSRLRSNWRRSSGRSPMAKVISMTWAGWQESRAAKRANLARLGLDVPSCRKTDHGTAGRRLRKAFEGQRVPRFGS